MLTRTVLACSLAALALTGAGCGDDESGTADTPATDVPAADTDTAGTDRVFAESNPAPGKPRVRIPSGPLPKDVEIRDIEKGTGATAKLGDEIAVHYVSVAMSNRKETDSSYDARRPFEFKLGETSVVQGWHEGIPGMKVGGRRELIVPPDKAYGTSEHDVIKPNETLLYVIDLVDIK